MRTILRLFLAVWTAQGVAQKADAPPAAPAPVPVSTVPPSSETGQNTIPVYKLDFKAGDPIPGFTAPTAIVRPIQCSSDGAVFFNALVPPDFSSHLISSINSKSVVNFSPKSVPDLQDIEVMDYYPSDSLLGLLVLAERKDTEGSLASPARPDNQLAARERAAERQQYIVEFDRNGSYKKSIELPRETKFFHFAILPSDNLLLSGFDTANNVPRLLLLRSDGAVIRPVELPPALDKTRQLDQVEHDSSGPNGLAGSRLFARGTFTTQQGGTVYWLPGTSTVLEIGEGGYAREVQTKAPKDYSLDTIIPSNGRWIVRFKRANLPEDGPVDNRPSSKNFLLYEVDSHDGVLLRQLQLADSQVNWIACEHDSKLLAFRMDQKQNLIPMSADLPK